MSPRKENGLILIAGLIVTGLLVWVVVITPMTPHEQSALKSGLIEVSALVTMGLLLYGVVIPISKKVLLPIAITVLAEVFVYYPLCLWAYIKRVKRRWRFLRD
jgi:hypothetical protein